MSIRARGKTWLGDRVGTTEPMVFSDAAQFTTDPQIDRDWPHRRVAMENIGGGVTHQDFGKYAADLRLTLVSNKNYITHEFKSYVDGLDAVRGAVYDYKDYQGIEAEVVIMEWQTKPTFIKDGLGVLYEYQLVLQVLDLSKLDFEDYSGS